MVVCTLTVVDMVAAVVDKAVVVDTPAVGTPAAVGILAAASYHLHQHHTGYLAVPDSTAAVHPTVADYTAVDPSFAVVVDNHIHCCLPSWTTTYITASIVSSYKEVILTTT